MKSNNIFLLGSLISMFIILVIIYFHMNINLKLIEGYGGFGRYGGYGRYGEYGYKTIGYYGGNGYEYPLYFKNDYPVSYPVFYSLYYPYPFYY